MIRPVTAKLFEIMRKIYGKQKDEKRRENKYIIIETEKKISNIVWIIKPGLLDDTV